MVKHRNALLVPLVVGLAALGAGCAQMGYDLGSMLPPDIQTVYVPTVINETAEPQLEIEVTDALIRGLQLDGSLKVASESEADAILQSKLIDYKLVPIAYRRDRATAADEYRILLTAAFMLTRNGTGEVLAQSPRVMGESTFVLEGDLTSSKRIGLPAAADDLAHDLVEKIVEYW